MKQLEFGEPQPDVTERVFIGKYPAGLVYADRKRQVGGDYKTLAFMPYDTLKLEIRRGCPKPLEHFIRDHAAQYRTGQQLQVATNLTVTLGSALIGRTAGRT